MSAVVGGSRQRFARRRRQRRWRSARPVVVLAVVVVILAGVVLWTLWFTGLFGVRRVEVTGARALSVSVITRAAGVRTGEPMARVDVSAVRGRVTALPGVADARVVRSWPSTVRIVVTERTAVAAVTRGGQTWLVDGDAVPFERAAGTPSTLPMLRFADGDLSSAAARAAVTVARSLPGPLRATVATVSADDPEAVRLSLRDGRTVLWGDAGRGGEKARVLPALLRQPGSVYDVSTPSVVVVH